VQAFLAHMEDRPPVFGPGGWVTAVRGSPWVSGSLGGAGLLAVASAAFLQGEFMETQLQQLKTKRAVLGDDPRTAVLDQSIEKLALNSMVAAREKLFDELTAASLRVRTLTAQIRGASIFLREHAEACKDPDVAAKLMAQIERWLAGSMPSTAASPSEIQEGRGYWLRVYREMIT
jgi:hypothetical protein